MKTKSVGPILAIAIVAGLTASFALYVKHAEVKVRKQATHLNQLAVQNEAPYEGMPQWLWCKLHPRWCKNI